MINIIFCGNDKIIDGVITCSLSILKNSKTKEPFNFLIFTMDASSIKDTYLPISDKSIEILSEVIKEYNPLNQIKKIDVTDLFNEYFLSSPNANTPYSPYTLLRLFADLVEDVPGKALYLDCDIMLTRDIVELYDIDVTGYEYAAARDQYGKYLCYPNFINAGVLLLNLDCIRKNNTMAKAREHVQEKKMLFPDQSALIKATTKKKMLSQKYNDQRRIRKNTVIRHFAKKMYFLPYPHIDNIKQWHIEKVHKILKYHQFDELYEEYLKIKEKITSEVK